MKKDESNGWIDFWIGIHNIIAFFSVIVPFIVGLLSIPFLPFFLDLFAEVIGYSLLAMIVGSFITIISACFVSLILDLFWGIRPDAGIFISR